MTNKERNVLYIWYDNGIKAQIKPTNKAVTEEMLKSFIKDAKGLKPDGHKSLEHKDTIFIRFQKFDIEISNVSKCIHEEFISDFLNAFLFKIEIDRIKKVTAHAQEVQSPKTSEVFFEEFSADRLIAKSNEEAQQKKKVAETRKPSGSYSTVTASSSIVRPNPSRSSSMVEPRKRPVSVKVTRNNKYSGKVKKIVAGFLVANLLSFGVGMYVGMKTSSEESIPAVVFEEPEIISSIPTVEINREAETFEVSLDINDVVPINSSNQLLEVENSNVYLSYENESQSSKAVETREKYGALIEKYAKKCGLDPRLILGIATQESGDHELGLRSGSRGGLMQIEVSFWDGKEIEYYDFDDKQTYLLKINRESLQNVENNILIGCAIFQNELRSYNNNIFLGILSYNQGRSNVGKILDKTSRQTGISKIQLINDPNNLEWLNYTEASGVGDPEYISNVLRYTGFGYDFYEFYCQKESGEMVTVTTGPIITETQKAM